MDCLSNESAYYETMANAFSILYSMFLMNLNYFLHYVLAVKYFSAQNLSQQFQHNRLQVEMWSVNYISEYRMFMFRGIAK